MENRVARDMLEALAISANAGAFDTHMNLISKDVSVYGVPGFEVIGYHDWSRQCEHEFDEGVLKSVSYEGLHLINETSDSVLFKTIETVEGTDGKVNRHAIEILIRQEVDGKWRVFQERILGQEEMQLESMNK